MILGRILARAFSKNAGPEPIEAQKDSVSISWMYGVEIEYLVSYGGLILYKSVL